MKKENLTEKSKSSQIKVNETPSANTLLKDLKEIADLIEHNLDASIVPDEGDEKNKSQQ